MSERLQSMDRKSLCEKECPILRVVSVYVRLPTELLTNNSWNESVSKVINQDLKNIFKCFSAGTKKDFPCLSKFVLKTS